MEENGRSNGNVDVSSARRGRRDHSSALAEKLLQGWTMLQEHCPHCLTPLVRNRLRRIYCVGCEQWVVSDAELAPPVQQVPQDQSQAQAPDRSTNSTVHMQAATTSTTATTTATATATTDSRSGLAAAVAASAKDTSALRNTSDVSPPSSQTLLIPKIECTSTTLIQQVLPDIADILGNKLKELGIALSKSQDVDDIRKLMDAIRECLHTIKDVKMMM